MGKKILIVEDSESFGALVSSQLEKAGFDTLVTPDAMLGTREAGRWKPDLVLLDLMLPAGGGVGVLRNMKRSVFTQNIPVLVITSSTDPALRKQILELGVKTIIQKPFQPEELVSLINNSLSKI